MKNKNLRMSVKMLRVQKGLDYRGSLGIIAKAISVHRSSLSMALTGFRNGPGTRAILEKAKEYLLTQPTAR